MSFESVLLAGVVSVFSVVFGSAFPLRGLFSEDISVFGAGIAFVSELDSLVGFEIRSLLGLGGLLVTGGVTIAGLAACKSSI